MGLFSVVLNLITIFIVSFVLYIGYNIYKTGADNSMSASEIFNKMLSDTGSITHAYMTETALGPIGDFVSYDWGVPLETTQI